MKMTTHQPEHYNNLQKLCRICGERRNKGRPYHSQTFETQIKEVFGVDISDDRTDVQPKYLCFNCQSQISEPSNKVKEIIPVEWKGHDDDDDCWVCDIKTVVRPESFAVPEKPAHKRRKSEIKITVVKKEAAIKLKELNEHIVCSICSGYIVDATTVTECLHSFCKSCLVKHLQTRQTCPQCKILIHETAPMQYIGTDTKLQDVVNKLVPGLMDSEIKRRNDFYANRGLSVPLNGNSSRPITPNTQDSEPAKFPPEDGRTWLHTNDLKMSLCIEPVKKEPSIPQMPMKFIRCSMKLKVEHLTKYIKQKTLISDEIELTCNKKTLATDVTLENVWLETWKRKEAPMTLFYNKKK